jgi:hypothetical protein
VNSGKYTGTLYNGVCPAGSWFRDILMSVAMDECLLLSSIEHLQIVHLRIHSVSHPQFKDTLYLYKSLFDTRHITLHILGRHDMRQHPHEAVCGAGCLESRRLSAFLLVPTARFPTCIVCRCKLCCMRYNFCPLSNRADPFIIFSTAPDMPIVAYHV